jgi:hypothetical protein
MILKTVAILALLVLSGPAFAQASEQQSLGEFGVWKAYKFQENGNDVCYMAASPDKHEGKYSRRGDIVAMITHRPAEGTKNVFSYMAGYAYKKGSNVDVLIDGRAFTLFTQNDMAWAADAAADASLAEAVQRGSKMVVKGVSAKGTETKDSFSLRGSSKAYQAITEACATL